MISQGVSITGTWKFQYLLDRCDTFSYYSSEAGFRFRSLDCSEP